MGIYDTEIAALSAGLDVLNKSLSAEPLPKNELPYESDLEVLNGSILRDMPAQQWEQLPLPVRRQAMLARFIADETAQSSVGGGRRAAEAVVGKLPYIKRATILAEEARYADDIATIQSSTALHYDDLNAEDRAAYQRVARRMVDEKNEAIAQAQRGRLNRGLRKVGGVAVDLAGTLGEFLIAGGVAGMVGKGLGMSAEAVTAMLEHPMTMAAMFAGQSALYAQQQQASEGASSSALANIGVEPGASLATAKAFVTGAGLGLALGGMGRIPAATTAAKVAKIGGESALFGGVAAAEGAPPEDILLQALIPGGLAGLRAFAARYPARAREIAGADKASRTLIPEFEKKADREAIKAGLEKIIAEQEFVGPPAPPDAAVRSSIPRTVEPAIAGTINSPLAFRGQEAASAGSADTGNAAEIGRTEAGWPSPLMKGDVLPLLENPKILDAVIRLLPIEVVNDLVGAKGSAEDLLNKPSVYLDVLSGNETGPIGVRARDATASALASLGAKLRLGGAAAADVELGPTIRASDLRPSEAKRLIDIETGLFHPDNVTAISTPSSGGMERALEIEGSAGMGKQRGRIEGNGSRTGGRVESGQQGQETSGPRPPEVQGPPEAPKAQALPGVAPAEDLGALSFRELKKIGRDLKIKGEHRKKEWIALIEEARAEADARESKMPPEAPRPVGESAKDYKPASELTDAELGQRLREQGISVSTSGARPEWLEGTGSPVAPSKLAEKKAQALKDLDQSMKDVRDYIAKSPGKLMSVAAPFDPELLGLVTKIVGNAIRAGTYTFAEFINQMAQKIGRARTMVLAPMWEEAWRRAKADDKTGFVSDVGRTESMILRSAPETQPLIGAPRLAVPTTDAMTRNVYKATDELRAEAGVPEPRRVADVRAQATQRLAADYAGTSAEIMELWKSGRPLTRDETAAAQQIAERMTASPDMASPDVAVRQRATLDAMEWTAAYRGSRSETAASLQIGYDPLEPPAVRFQRYINRDIYTPPRRTAKEIESASAAVQSAREAVQATKASGTPSEQSAATEQLQKQIATLESAKAKAFEQIEALKGQLAAVGIDLAKLSDYADKPIERGKIARAVRQAKLVTWRERWPAVMYEFWMNGILSAPTTHVTNALSTLTHGTYEFAVIRTLSPAINAALRNEKGATFEELPYLWAGLKPKLAQAARDFLTTWTSEIPEFQRRMGLIAKGKETSKTESRAGAIPGKFGRFWRWPTRLLSATDDFCMSLFAQMDVGARAYRIAKGEGLRGPELTTRVARLTSDLQSPAWAQALGEAERLAFHSEAGPIAKGLIRLRQEAPPLTFIVPFIVTPANILKLGVKMTPLGSIGRARRAWEAYRISRGGFIDPDVAAKAFPDEPANKAIAAYRAQRVGEIPDLIAREMMSWAVPLALWYSNDQKDPWITGAASQYERAERQLAQRTGRTPMSIRLGDRWYSYSRLEPFATALALIVDAQAGIRQGSIRAPLKGAAGQLWDKTFLQGIGDVMQALQQPQDQLPRWTSSFAASWIPNAIRSALNAAQETYPQTQVTGRGTEWLGNLAVRTAQRVGGAAWPGEAAYDLWGRPAKKGPALGPTTDFVWRLLVPSRTAVDDVFLGDRILNNYHLHNPEGWLPIIPAAKYRGRDGKNRTMTDVQYATFLRDAGQEATRRVAATAWQNVENPTEIDIKRMKDILSDAHEHARRKLMREIGSSAR